MNTKTFSYHTFMLKKQLLGYAERISVLKTLSPYEENRFKKGTVTYRLNIPGCRFTVRYADSTHAVLEIVVNPCRLLGNPSFKKLFNPSEKSFWSVTEAFDQVMDALGIPLQFKDFKLQRLDLCADFSLSSQQEADIYMKVIKKTKMPTCYEEERFPDTMENSDGKNLNSYRIKATNRTFTVYDKDYQMWDQGLNSLEEDSKNVLRFELALQRKFIHGLQKDYNIDNTIELLDKIVMEGICEKYFTEFIFRLFPEGEYCSYALARAWVDAAITGKKQHAAAVDVLKCITRCETVDDAIDLLRKQGLTYGRIEKSLANFEKIGVNPITIPETYLPHRNKRFSLPGIPELFRRNEAHLYPTTGSFHVVQSEQAL